MKKIKALLLLVPLFLGSCVRNNGLCYTHVDTTGDGICDVCGQPMPVECNHEYNDLGVCIHCGAQKPLPPAPVQPCKEHVDHNLDGICDVCGADMSKGEHTHIDSDGNGKCDICGATMSVCEHLDANHDGKCDYCGAKMDLPVGKVTTYLVLSSVGRYKGQVGMNEPSKNLENVIKFDADMGSPLPGKEDVTQIYGSADFESWLCYEGKGAPTVYTTVPYEADKILYANFVANGKSPVEPTPGPGPTPPTPTKNETFYLNTLFENGSSNWNQDGAQFYVWVWNDFKDERSYPMNKVEDSKYSVDLPVNDDGSFYYTSIIFCRVNASAGSFAWDNVWDQTQDMKFDSGKRTARLSGWKTAYWEY